MGIFPSLFVIILHNRDWLGPARKYMFRVNKTTKYTATVLIIKQPVTIGRKLAHGLKLCIY